MESVLQRGHSESSETKYGASGALQEKYVRDLDYVGIREEGDTWTN